MSQDTSNDPESEEIVKLSDALLKVDENKPDAEFNAAAMRDSNGLVINFTRNPGGQPPYTREQLLAAGAIYRPKKKEKEEQKKD